MATRPRKTQKSELVGPQENPPLPNDRLGRAISHSFWILPIVSFLLGQIRKFKRR